MSTEVNHDSGDTGDTGEHGGYQGGDNGQESGYGHDDSGFSNSGNDEDQNGYGHESASEDEGHQFSTVQEHMGFTTGFGPAADLPRNAFGVPDYRGFSMPDNKANSLSFGKSPESYGTQRNMTFGTSFDPNNDLRKNAFGVPEYRGFRMPSGGESVDNMPAGAEPSAFEKFSRYLEQRGQDISRSMAYNIRGNMTADEHTAYINERFSEGPSPIEFGKGLINYGKPSDAEMWNAPPARQLGRMIGSPGLDPEGFADTFTALGKLASGAELDDGDKWNIARPIGGSAALLAAGGAKVVAQGLGGLKTFGGSLLGKIGVK